MFNWIKLLRAERLRRRVEKASQAGYTHGARMLLLNGQAPERVSPYQEDDPVAKAYWRGVDFAACDFNRWLQMAHTTAQAKAGKALDMAAFFANNGIAVEVVGDHTIQINGSRFSAEVFADLTGSIPIGATFMLVSRDDSVVVLKRQGD